MDAQTKTKIRCIINCIETGKPTTAYDAITILRDGPQRQRQVTLSTGFTQGGGDLKQVIDTYVAKNGTFSKDFVPYQNRVSTDYSLVNDSKFIDLLKESSQKDQLMRDSQNEIFESLYWVPALKFAGDNGFVLPLSILVIYDSYVQSGRIFDFLRAKFPAKVPAKGGKEQDWTAQYLQARYDWIANHTNADVRASLYRVKDYLRVIKNGNWQLTAPVIANDVTVN